MEQKKSKRDRNNSVVKPVLRSNITKRSKTMGIDRETVKISEDFDNLPEDIQSNFY